MRFFTVVIHAEITIKVCIRYGKAKVLLIQATEALRVGRGIVLPNLRPRH